MPFIIKTKSIETYVKHVRHKSMLITIERSNISIVNVKLATTSRGQRFRETNWPLNKEKHFSMSISDNNNLLDALNKRSLLVPTKLSYPVH